MPASIHELTRREDGAAAEEGELGGMWQGGVVGTMQTRGQPKYGKWGNTGHKLRKTSLHYFL